MKHVYRFFLVALFLFFVVEGKSQLNADFTADTLKGCAPFTLINFTNLSTGSFNKVSWDFDNDGSFDLEGAPGVVPIINTPSWIFSTPGVYSIRLVIADTINGFEDERIFENYISSFESPSADFEADDSSGCGTLQVSFSDLTEPGGADIISWLWVYGNGDGGNQQNPVVNYVNGSSVTVNYQVALVVVDGNQCSSNETKNNYISLNPGVIPGFELEPPGGCEPPLKVKINNQSEGIGALTYHWDFGNGETSDVADPPDSIIYNDFGTFPVVLTLTSDLCEKVLTKPVVISNDLDVSFDFSSNCEGKITRFTNNSESVFDTFFWEFGDGTTSSAVNPNHVYAIGGDYLVKLTASIGTTCTTVYEEQITVSEPESIEYDENMEYVVCEYPKDIFVQVFNDNLDSLNWVVKDENGNVVFFGTNVISMEFTENNPIGVYELSMYAFFESGCEDSLDTPILINVAVPTAGGISDVPRNMCLPLDIEFADTSFFEFGIDSTYWTVIHADTVFEQTSDSIFVFNLGFDEFSADTGFYDVFITVVTLQGCVATVQTDTIGAGMHTYPDFIWRHPDLENGEDTIKMCYRDTLGFFYTGPDTLAYEGADTNRTDTVIPHVWNWSIDITSNDINPIAQFNEPDTNYFVMLVTEHFMCLDTVQWEIDSIIGVGPVASFFADTTFFCLYDTLYEVQFTNISTFDTLASTFQWVFDPYDTDTIVLMEPELYTYPEPGTYPTTLIINTVVEINPDEFLTCPDTLVFPESPLITIDNYELLNLNPINMDYNFCESEEAELIVNLNSTYFLPQYTQNLWYFGDDSDPAVTFFNEETVHHIYEEPGAYDLTVVGTNGICFDTLVQVVNVFVDPIADFNFDSISVCAPAVVDVFDASVQGDSAITEWQYLSIPQQSSPAPETPNSQIEIEEGVDYIVLLLVTDKNGCEGRKIDTIPVHDILIDVENQHACNEVPYLVNYEVGNIDFPPLSFEWTFGNGVIDTTDSPEVLFTDIHKDSVVINSVVIIDTTGCSDTSFFEIGFTVPQISASNIPGELNCDADGSFASFYSFTIESGDLSIVETIIIDFGDGTNTVIDSSSVFNFLHTYTTPGVFSVTVTAVDTNGCSTTEEFIDWVLVEGPLVNPFYTVLDSCPPLEVQFDVEDPINVDEYTWIFGENGPTDNIPNPTHIYNQAGAFQPELWAKSSFVDSEGNPHTCTIVYDNMDSIKIDGPTLDFELESEVNCEGLEVNINNFSVNSDIFGAVSWQWDFGDGTVIDQDNIDPIDPPPHIYTEGGDYTITLTGVSEGGFCVYTLEDTTVYIVPSLDINPGFDVSNGCAPLIVEFTPDIDGDIELVSDPFWEFGDDSTSTEMKPTHKYLQPGTAFAVTFSYTYSECPFDVEISNTVNTFDDPIAGFEFFPNVENNAVNSYEVINQSDGEVSVDWVLDGVVISSENTLNVPVLEEGSTLSLIAFSDKLCTDTIEVSLEPIAYVNIITPNGDTFNDELVFDLSEDQMQCTSLNVYNRWGKLVYSDGSYSNDWKGVNNSGNNLDEGTYFYILEICGRGAIKGYVTIVR